MLVLSRKLNEQIRIGDSITVTVLRVKGNAVRIGIEAPREVRVRRNELAPKTDRPDADAAEGETGGHDRSEEALGEGHAEAGRFGCGPIHVALAHLHAQSV